MSHVVMFSGGITSYATAKRTIAQHGGQGVTLLFCDTTIEHPDTYRFISEASAHLGVPLVTLRDGRSPREVFRDRRMLGNSRIAPCSTELKQKPARRWMEENAPDAAVVLGIDWTEEHRLPGARAGWEPWRVEAPLTEPPYRTKDELLDDLEREGIARPALYRMGFSHNNCGGGCPRAGLAQWSHLYRTDPAWFGWWEETEEYMRDYLRADVAMLRDRRGGDTQPLTLRSVREQLERQPALFANEEWGGCGCFVSEEPRL